MSRERDAEFVAFVEGNSPRLLRAAWLICGDAATAEDMVQNALEKAYLRWSRLDPAGALAYVRRILVNDHIDTRRRRRREELTATPPDTASVTGDIPDSRFLAAALAPLTKREREVVVLRHYVGLSEADTADLLGVSVGTVKSTASRGRTHLRSVLASRGVSP